jgi:bifunctional ADP-heptose synthase (sugar kinase/adenylyltransferase)
MTVQQKSLNVLVIGETCRDIYYYCSNTRLNPESSAPLVKVTRDNSKLGMAANVNNCLNSLGVKTNFITNHPSSHPTRTRYINEKTNQQLLRVDIDPKLEELSPIRIDLNKYSAIVISDYNKGFITTFGIQNIISNFDGPVFLDTKKKNLHAFSKCFIKINETEANAADSIPLGTIVTCGADGVRWYDSHWPAYKTEIVDVCGAGDAFLAGLVYGYLTNEERLIEYAIVNAGISVRHLGTYAPSLKELKQGLNEYLSDR